MKTTADRGYAYEAIFGAEKTGGSITKGWYKIVTKSTGATGNILPAQLKVGDVYHQGATATLGSNEKVKPITLTKICFLNSLSVSATREKQDVTTWCDETKDYIASAVSEQTGSASGYFEDASMLQESIFGQFITTVKQDGNNITRVAPSGSTVYLMQSIREKDAQVGELVTWRWLPMIIDSMDFNTESATAVPFSFNFTLKGSENPMLIRLRL